MDLEAIKIEYDKLIRSQEWAFAMGHGCSMGDHPRFQAIRERANSLRAQIEEHEVTP
jgi:hypothetical protein